MLLVAVALATVAGVAGCGDGEAHVPMAADKRGEGTWERDQPSDDELRGCWSAGDDEPICVAARTRDPDSDASLPDPPDSEVTSIPEPETVRTQPPLPPAVNGVRVLYDEKWTVEEGQWTLDASGDIPDGPSFRRLLESTGGTTAWINVPGFYGNYRTRVELHESGPTVPGWCEDAAEVSIQVRPRVGGVVMGSFETYEHLPVNGPGWYRVRYCTEKQDLAATQDEFTGDEYTTYAGRHLIQLWKAPRRSDEILREGSRWARSLQTQ